MRKLNLYRVLPLAVGLAIAFAMSSDSLRAQEHGAATEAGAETHGASAAEHADAGHADAEHANGEVPLDFKSNLAFWSLIVFIVYVLVLKKFAWGPLSDGLNQREARIQQNIAAAEQARIKAEQMLAAHAAKLDKVQDEVREIIAEARRDAEHTKQDIVSQATKEAEATKQRAVTEINRARDAALKDLFDVMATQVASATEHVLARSLTDQDHRRLIDEGLAQFRQN